MIDESTRLAQERTALAAERNWFANQRTFLSWMRTGLASVGGGVAAIRLLVFQNPSHRLISQYIGASLIVTGIFIFMMSFWDYYEGYAKLKSRIGRESSLWPIASVALIFCLVSGLLLLILLREPE